MQSGQGRAGQSCEGWGRVGWCGGRTGQGRMVSCGGRERQSGERMEWSGMEECTR
jgi:hypothetical protein